MGAPHTSPAERPNVLLIMTDQHRAASTGCYGPTDARTPNIDALAGQSVLFEHAYCQYPICAASRQSLLTGRYPGRHGLYQNNLHAIDPYQWTLPGALARAGYETALIGKAHCNENGFLYVLESERYAARYWPRETFAAIQPPLFGLDYRRNAETAGPWPHDERYLQSRFVTEQTISYLKRTKDRPFFLMASYDFPHPPFRPPHRWWDAFDPDALTLPPMDPVQPVSPHWGEELLNETMLRQYLRGYYACLAAVDEEIGRVLSAVDAEGLAANTIVIYLSDHGEAGGCHGKYEKHSFFDPEVHVPLLIRIPGRVPRRVSEYAELIDVAPSILAWAGVDGCGAGLDGAPLHPLMEGKPDGWKNRAICENYWPERVERDGTTSPEDYGRMMVRDGFKCCIGGNMPYAHCLFDLRKDPGELRNVWDDPAHIMRRNAMVRDLEADWVRLPSSSQVRGHP